MTSRTIGGFELQEQLGEGAMGTVYRARQPALDRLVAVKLLRETLETPALIARFRREGEIQASLAHPNLVRVFDCGIDGDELWIAMELVTGKTLAHYIDRTAPHPIDFVVPVGQALAGALAHLHERGIVHRDLKPQNVLVADSGTVKLADFGVARQEGRTRMTAEGALVGTVCYMAPEALESPAIPASDVYALGLILYEMATGKLPYGARDLLGWFDAIREAPIARPSGTRPDMPPELEQLILAMLDRAPEARPSAAGVERQLGEVAVRAGASHQTLETRARTMMLDQRRDEEMTTAAWRTQALPAQAVRSAPVPAPVPPAPATALLPPPSPAAAKAASWPRDKRVLATLCAATLLLGALALLPVWAASLLRSADAGSRARGLSIVRLLGRLALRGPAPAALIELIGDPRFPGDGERALVVAIEAGLPLEPCARSFAAAKTATVVFDSALERMLAGERGDELWARWLDDTEVAGRIPERIRSLLKRGGPRPAFEAWLRAHPDLAPSAADETRRLFRQIAGRRGDGAFAVAELVKRVESDATAMDALVAEWAAADRDVRKFVAGRLPREVGRTLALLRASTVSGEDWWRVYAALAPVAAPSAAVIELARRALVDASEHPGSVAKAWLGLSRVLPEAQKGTPPAGRPLKLAAFLGWVGRWPRPEDAGWEPLRRWILETGFSRGTRDVQLVCLEWMASGCEGWRPPGLAAELLRGMAARGAVPIEWGGTVMPRPSAYVLLVVPEPKAGAAKTTLPDYTLAADVLILDKLGWIGIDAALDALATAPPTVETIRAMVLVGASRKQRILPASTQRMIGRYRESPRWSPTELDRLLGEATFVRNHRTLGDAAFQRAMADLADRVGDRFSLSQLASVRKLPAERQAGGLRSIQYRILHEVAEPEYRAFLTDPRADVRLAAVEGLDFWACDRAAPELRRMASDPDEAVRAAVARRAAACAR
jgi:tRNA A-37 threonylcarbamoyl transferase component Bud32